MLAVKQVLDAHLGTSNVQEVVYFVALEVAVLDDES